MSKQELKKYIKGLEKDQLEEQILDLYSRFKEVKTFYNFVFNPKEDKLLEECKFKISKEYFPLNSRKPKARRSVAQKYIRHFNKLGVDSSTIADIMLFNIEVAQSFSSERTVKQDSFYISMLRSFNEAKQFIKNQGLITQFQKRVNEVVEETWKQDWFNKQSFNPDI